MNSGKVTVIFSSLCPGITQVLAYAMVLAKSYNLEMFHVNLDCLPHGICYKACYRACIPNPACNPVIHLDANKKRVTFRGVGPLEEYLKKNLKKV